MKEDDSSLKRLDALIVEIQSGIQCLETSLGTQEAQSMEEKFQGSRRRILNRKKPVRLAAAEGEREDQTLVIEHDPVMLKFFCSNNGSCMQHTSLPLATCTSCGAKLPSHAMPYHRMVVHMDANNVKLTLADPDQFDSDDSMDGSN